MSPHNLKIITKTRGPTITKNNNSTKNPIITKKEMMTNINKTHKEGIKKETIVRKMATSVRESLGHLKKNIRKIEIINMNLPKLMDLIGLKEITRTGMGINNRPMINNKLIRKMIIDRRTPNILKQIIKKTIIIIQDKRIKIDNMKTVKLINITNTKRDHIRTIKIVAMTIKEITIDKTMVISIAMIIDTIKKNTINKMIIIEAQINTIMRENIGQTIVKSSTKTILNMINKRITVMLKKILTLTMKEKEKLVIIGMIKDNLEEGTKRTMIK